VLSDKSGQVHDPSSPDRATADGLAGRGEPALKARRNEEVYKGEVANEVSPRPSGAESIPLRKTSRTFSTPV
jgi:hypothetical protein